jgi:hypothetical protein
MDGRRALWGRLFDAVDEYLKEKEPFTHGGLWDEEAVRSHEGGWGRCFDNLDRTLRRHAHRGRWTRRRATAGTGASLQMMCAPVDHEKVCITSG